MKYMYLGEYIDIPDDINLKIERTQKRIKKYEQILKDIDCYIDLEKCFIPKKAWTIDKIIINETRDLIRKQRFTKEQIKKCKNKTELILMNYYLEYNKK